MTVDPRTLPPAMPAIARKTREQARRWTSCRCGPDLDVRWHDGATVLIHQPDCPLAKLTPLEEDTTA